MSAEGHVSPQQQGYVFTRSGSQKPSGYTTYAAHQGDYRVATLAVLHKPEVHEQFTIPEASATVKTPEGGMWTGGVSSFRPEQLSGPGVTIHSPYTKGYHELYTNWGDEAPLFGSYKGEPARDKVDSLFTTKKNRAVAPLMLGMAQNRSLERTGQGLQTPHDLSPHSAGMVQHLQQRGVVPSGAPNEVQNDYSWSSPVFDPPDRESKDILSTGGREIVGEREVAAGRRTVRQTLRGDRGQRQTNRSEQLRLF